MTESDANKLITYKYPGARIFKTNNGRSNHSNIKCCVTFNNSKTYEYKGSYEDVLKRLGVINSTTTDRAISDMNNRLKSINPFLSI